MEEKRRIIAENISNLRRSSGLTQAELAERLNYSDKAISKWERGDSIPDVLLLSELADMFSVTVDYFLHPHTEEEKKPRADSMKKNIRFAVTLTSCIFPFFVATILYVVFSISFSGADWLWKLFVTPLPVVFLLTLIFSSIWLKKKIGIFASLTALLWSIIMVVYVFINHIPSSSMIFLVGIPLQTVITLWYFPFIKK